MHNKVRDLGNVIRCIVAVLGFAPVESLVLLLVRGGVLATALRVDLADATRADAPVRLAEMVSRQDVDGVIAVVVSEEGASCPPCGTEFRAMVDDVALEMIRHGDRLVASVMVDRLAQGGRWSCLDSCGVGGVLDDPSTSDAAAAAVADGRRMYGSRAEMATLVAVDEARVAALAPMLGVPGPVDSVAVSVRAAVDAMRRMAGGEVLGDAELAAVGATLVDKRVRDALFNIGDADQTAAAESLWTLLARVLPAPFRVEALTLLAFSCYLRGEGPLAGVALEAALVDNPEHTMAGMLDTALQGGLHPDRMRGLIAKIPPAVSV